MKYAKMLGLLAVMVAAFMAFAGSASAATLTSPTGTPLSVGSVIKATSEAPHTKLDGTVTITCELSHVEGVVTNPGGVVLGKTETVKGNITKLEWTNCGNNTVTTVTGGELQGHSLGNGNLTLTSTGAEVTVLTHNILGTAHCIYKTNATHIGTLTGAHNTPDKQHATLDIGSAPIPQTATDGICGNDAEWTGNYTVTSPTPLYAD